MTPLIWSVVLAGMTLLAGWLTSRLRWYGWALATVTQTLWATYGLTSGQLGFVVSALVFGVFNARTARRWYRERPDRPTPPPTAPAVPVHAPGSPVGGPP